MGNTQSVIFQKLKILFKLFSKLVHESALCSPLLTDWHTNRDTHITNLPTVFKRTSQFPVILK